MTAPLWRVRLLRGLLVTLLVLGVCILLHGCHGDEDHELIVPFLRWVR